MNIFFTQTRFHDATTGDLGTIGSTATGTSNMAVGGVAALMSSQVQMTYGDASSLTNLVERMMTGS
jgi:hypothetical protein